MPTTFTTYEQALMAIMMVERFALQHGCTFPQHTICYFEGNYVVTLDTVKLPE